MKLKFFNNNNIDFLGKKYIAIIFSAILLIASIVSITLQGLKLGIDFTGGTIIEVGYEEAVNINDVRKKLEDSNYEKINVKYFGSDKEILIHINLQDISSAELSTDVIRILGDVDIRRVEFVGPKIGEELTNNGGLAMLYALIGILIYVAFRFEYRFALGSVVALMHDVLIVLGFFSIMRIEFDLTVLAAILAVIGYSLNDTIVVFDRIRENFLNSRDIGSSNTINNALNKTLSRTITTSLTTLVVLLALFYLGGEIIHGFSIALLIGVIVGTYSSIYIASSTVLILGVSKSDLVPSEKENKEIDARP